MRPVLRVLLLLALAPAAWAERPGRLEIKTRRGPSAHEVIGNEPVTGLHPDVRRLTLRGGRTLVFRPDERWRQEQFESKMLSPFGTRADAERALYATSARLGLRVVPRTRYGSLDGRRGSVQNDILGSDFSHPDRAAMSRWDWDSLHGVVVLQYVTGMLDGHEGNVIVDRSGPTWRFRVVDGETTFAGRRPYEPKSVLLPFLEHGPSQLSPRLWDRIRKTDVRMWRLDLQMLGVPPERIDAAMRRLELVKAHGLDAVRRGF